MTTGLLYPSLFTSNPIHTFSYLKYSCDRTSSCWRRWRTSIFLLLAFAQSHTWHQEWFLRPGLVIFLPQKVSSMVYSCHLWLSKLQLLSCHPKMASNFSIQNKMFIFKMHVCILSQITNSKWKCTSEANMGNVIVSQPYIIVILLSQLITLRLFSFSLSLCIFSCVA